MAVNPFSLIAAGAAGGSFLNNLFKGRPNIPNVSPIRPGRFEQATKSALLFGPGNEYDLGLYGATQTGTQRPQAPQGAPPSSGIQRNLRYRTSPATPEGFGDMVINPSYIAPTGERNYTDIQQGEPSDFYTDVLQGDAALNKKGKPKKKPNFNDLVQEAIRRGQTPFEQQLELEGVGQEAFKGGLMSGFEQIGDVNLIKNAITELAGSNRDRQFGLQDELRNLVTNKDTINSALFEQDVPVVNDLFGRAATEFGNINTADASSRARAFTGQAADIGTRGAAEGFTNTGVGRDITGKSLSTTDYIKNLLAQRFGQTDTFLGGLFTGGPEAADLTAINDIYSKNIKSAEDLFTTGRVGQKYDDFLLRSEEGVAGRGFTPASSAYTDAARKIETQRQQEFNDVINQENARRAQNILEALTGARETKLKAADITGQGANTLASNLAPLLNAATGGLSASNDAIRAALSGGSLVSEAARNEIDRGQLDLTTQQARASGLADVGTRRGAFATDAAGQRTAQQQTTQTGMAAVIDAALKGDTQALAALQGAGELGISAGNLSNAFANTGLEGQASGFNQLLSLFDIGKGNRQDKQKLAIFNALADAGLAGSIS